MSLNSISYIGYISSLATEFTFIGSLMLILLALSSVKFIPTLISYNDRRRITEKYHKMFEARDNLMYHISWARSNGRKDEMKQMMQDLIRLDKEIDSMEIMEEKPSKI